MLEYLLDTNTCVRYLNGRAPGIRLNLESKQPHSIAVCSVVKAELFAGAMKSIDPVRSLTKQTVFLSQFTSFPFDDTAALAFGNIRAELERVGTPIGPFDMQIAAIAIANNLILVTHNTREFTRVPNLKIVDWEV